MRFDEKGVLHGINPEYGFFGVCPGTNMKTNPNAMLACRKNTIFTNVAETRDGGVFWEGLEEEVDPVCMLQWPWPFVNLKHVNRYCKPINIRSIKIGDF